MRRLDELHLEHPHAGSRMLRDLLAAEGSKIGRRHVRTLMRQMGIEAVYRRPRTSNSAPGHKIFPYLLRGLTIDRANQVWASDITYIPMARGFVYLAAVMDWFARRILAWRLSITLGVDFASRRSMRLCGSMADRKSSTRIRAASSRVMRSRSFS
jgi:putative transposase